MKQIAALLTALGVCAFAIYKATKEKSPSEPIKPPKYSLDLIKLLTDSEWAAEREIVQKQYNDPKLDIDFRGKLWDILKLFDKVKSERDWAGHTPRGPVFNGEHGGNLYKPD